MDWACNHIGLPLALFNKARFRVKFKRDVLNFLRVSQIENLATCECRALGTLYGAK